MRIVALTKFKHGALFDAMRRLGWNQDRLTKECGIAASAMNDIINLRVPPSEGQANAIQRKLAENGIYLDVLDAWPEGFRGLGKKRNLTLIAELEVNPQLALEGTVAHILPPDRDFIENTEGNDKEAILGEIMEKAKLTSLEKSSVVFKFGVGRGRRSLGRTSSVKFGKEEKSVENAIERAMHKMRQAAKQLEAHQDAPVG